MFAESPLVALGSDIFTLDWVKTTQSGHSTRPVGRQVCPINGHRRLATWVHDIGQVRTRDFHARVVAFNNPALSMRSSARHSFVAETRIDSLGFRVVRQD